MVGLSLFPPPVVFVAGENSDKKQRKNPEKYHKDRSSAGGFLLELELLPPKRAI